MLIKQIYRVLLLALLGLASCTDDDGVGTVQRVDLLDFEFPQGNDPWDREIEQIAKDWGMYIIYKNVDSTHLNRCGQLQFITIRFMFVQLLVMRKYRYIWI